MTHGDGGKGSSRRVENSQAVRDGWDRIFGNKKQDEPMIDDDDNEDFNEDYDETDVEECPVCRGQMAITGTKMYLFCDTCGHREEVDHDYD